MSRLVIVVIPNYNGRVFLGPCLASLREQTFRDFRVLMVDDGSTDDSVAFVREHYPEVEVLLLKLHKSFCCATNAGIRATAAPLVALLNNDTEVAPGWLEALYRTMIAYPDVGFCACKMLTYDDHSRIDSAGLFLRTDGVGRSIGYGWPDGPEFGTLQEVFGASGGAALHRRAMLNDIGLFDEDFVAYGEDLDLSFRAQLRGYKCLYVPDAVVYHHGSGSFGQESPFKVYYSSRNMVALLIKNMPGFLILRHLPALLAAQLYQVIYFSTKGLAGPVLRGKWAALAEMRKTLWKRRKIMASRRVSDGYISSILSRGLAGGRWQMADSR